MLLSPAGLTLALSLAGLAGASPFLPIRSIDPADTDYSDLEAFGESIGSARLVLLGEQTHGDGAAFLAKTRLIKYLHARKGFSILAFETGMLDARLAWAQLRSGAPMANIREGLSIWSWSEQLGPLLKHVSTSSGSQRPLELAGFDCQTFLPLSAKRLGPELERVLSQLGLLDLTERLRPAMRALTEYAARPTPEERVLWLSTLKEAHAGAKQRGGAPHPGWA